MLKIHKKSIVILIAIIVCHMCFYQNELNTYASNSNKYLVLVQKKDGSWKKYRGIIEKSSSGNLMIKAKSISKALGFTYKNNNASFVLKRSSARYNTYRKNNNKFTYTNAVLTTVISASNIAYTSKTSKNNVCQVSTLSTLVYCKYFNSGKTKDYKSYRGVICFSEYNKIPTVIPKVNPVPTKKPTPTPKPEPTTIKIEGVEFLVRDKFLSVKKALSDWGGTGITWYKLEREVDGKIIKSTDLFIESNTIGYSHLSPGSDGIYLTKTKKGYKLSISVKLDGSVIADQNASIVKAMVVTISSKPSVVYQAILNSFTTGHTHGINEATYVTIGDCKVKIKLKDGEVIYYIMEAIQ